jgi:hypothetical protein
MPRMTKAQGRKRLKEISSKSKKLFLVGYISAADLGKIEAIVSMRSRKLKS